MQETHKSAMSPPALARISIHGFMNRDESQRTRIHSASARGLDRLLKETSTVDATRQQTSENKILFRPLRKDRNGAQQETQSWGSFQSRLARPRKNRYGQDRVRPFLMGDVQPVAREG
jgi:uncharacterized lipoprotein YehR (DUF1307 family)